MKDYIKDTLNYYDNNVTIYKKKWLNDFLINCNFEIPDIFLSYIKPNSRILDLGCGTGRDSKYFMDKGYNVKSIDGSKEMCKIAQKLIGMQVEQINFLDIEYINMFDGVFACASLLHLSNEDLLIVLKKILNALKNDGILYTCFKYGEESRVDDGRFYNDMTEAKFLDLCKNLNEFKILRTWITKQYNSESKFINYIMKKNK